MRFRTRSGSLYVLEDDALTRLSEQPVANDVTGRAIVRRRVIRHEPIEVGTTPRFWLLDESGMERRPLRVSRVVEVEA
jgi:hypothetical protein